MATNKKFGGFQPQAYGRGGTITYVRRQVTSNNTNAIYLRDVVDFDTNGNVLGFATTGTRTTAIASVFMGCSYQDANGVRQGGKHLPAATTYTGTGIFPDDAIYASVVENVPGVKFRCSIDTVLTRAALDANCSINLAAGVNGFSQQDVNAASVNSTATLPIRLTDFYVGADVDLTSATNQHAVVLINAGVLEPALTTTGLA